jgi:UDP-hydrolysing UDP-N-acetyl-D-glucosamine 2-epimerase
MELNAREDIELQVVCTGTHLLERYGSSAQDIINDGIAIAGSCFVLVEGETLETMSTSIGLAIIQFSSILSNLKPDLLLVMGDRFEAMANALAGNAMNIPVAHIQGGEISGSFDESLRHAITKLAHIHFPSTELSRQRIISMGEDPRLVFNLGCPAVDSLLKVRLLSIDEVLSHPLLAPKRQTRKKFLPKEGYVLTLFHPVTTEYDQIAHEAMELLRALDELNENVFWVWPNADAGARKIVRTVDRYLANKSDHRFDFFDHIPPDVFISLMARSKLMVGNSSAGIREACYFGVPVVDVGIRQWGRERAPNVIEVHDVRMGPLLQSMKAQLDHGPYAVCPLYGEGNSGRRIADVLSTIKVDRIQKRFFDHFLDRSSQETSGWDDEIRSLSANTRSK